MKLLPGQSVLVDNPSLLKSRTTSIPAEKTQDFEFARYTPAKASFCQTSDCSCPAATGLSRPVVEGILLIRSLQKAS
jgi:hypothetical protein